MKKLLVLLITISFWCSFTLFAQTEDLYATSFEKFLNDVMENSIRNYDWNDHDWEIYRNKQLARLPINDKQQFRNATIAALVDLGDHHSFLMQENFSDDTNNSSTDNTKPFSITHQNGIGIVTIKGYMAKNFDPKSLLSEELVNSFHIEFAKVQKNVSKGWIIDLSNNPGGSMIPMLAMISPFIKNQNLGGLSSYPRHQQPQKEIFAFNGKDFIFKGLTESEFVTYSYVKQYPIGTVNLPVMVIIGADTYSSGEIVALALERQPNVTLIGQPSGGLATGNAAMNLPNDFGTYLLTTSHDLDKNDNPLLSGIVSPKIELDLSKDSIEEAIRLINL